MNRNEDDEGRGKGKRGKEEEAFSEPESTASASSTSAASSSPQVVVVIPSSAVPGARSRGLADDGGGAFAHRGVAEVEALLLLLQRRLLMMESSSVCVSERRCGQSCCRLCRSCFRRSIALRLLLLLRVQEQVMRMLLLL